MKGMQLLLGNKVVFWRWILVLPVLNQSIAVLLSVQNVRGGFIVIVLMCLGRWVYYCVQMSLSLECLAHNHSVEKLEFKRDEDVLEVKKFCYLGDVISCYGQASEAVSARIGSVLRKFRELSGVLVGKQGLSLKQWEIYQCWVRPVSLYCCERWYLLLRMEHHMIRMMCGVRLVDRESTDVLHDKVGVVTKIKDMIMQSHLLPYGNVIHWDINSQICEVMNLEITGKRKKGQPRKL